MFDAKGLKKTHMCRISHVLEIRADECRGVFSSSKLAKLARYQKHGKGLNQADIGKVQRIFVGVWSTGDFGRKRDS